MQSISPDYKARKQGQPTMPLKERLYSKIMVMRRLEALKDAGD